MSGTLLDTVVLSELRKRDCAHAVVDWFDAQMEATLYISVLSLGEIARGIARAETRDPEFAATLGVWLEQLQTLYAEHLLSFDAASARVWGRLSFELGHAGVDLQIAATALARGMTVATRNTRHFEATGVQLVDPWAFR